MNNQKRKNAIKILEEEILKYSKVLNRLLMEEIDVNLKNGVYFPKAALNHINLERIRKDIKKFTIIISDLMLIQQALKKHQKSVIVYEQPNLHIETCNSLDAAELIFDDDGLGEIWFV